MPDGGESGAAMTAKSQAEAVARNDALFATRTSGSTRSRGRSIRMTRRCSPSCASAPTSAARRSCSSAPGNTSSCGGTDPLRDGAGPRGRRSSARVVAENDRYATVEKLGAAARGRARPSGRAARERAQAADRRDRAIFRSVNEQVRGLTATLSTPGDTLRIVCECGARSADQFEIDLSAYAEIRAD